MGYPEDGKDHKAKDIDEKLWPKGYYPLLEGNGGGQFWREWRLDIQNQQGHSNGDDAICEILYPTIPPKVAGIPLA